MEIPGGYILQPRKIDDSDIMREAPVIRELWFYLLRRVNHTTEGKYKRGSAFFNLGDIQEALHWYVGYRKQKYSKPQLTKSLRRLRERNMIETAKATRGVYVTVLNYDFYQDPNNYERNDEDQTKETRKKRWGHTKNKNEKNEEEEKNSLPESVLKFARDYYGYISQTYPEKKINLKNGKIERGAETIDKLIRLDGYDLDDHIRPALQWGLKDEFWNAQLNSLAELRKKKSGSENHKFDNLYQRYVSNKPKQKVCDLEY